MKAELLQTITSLVPVIELATIKYDEDMLCKRPSVCWREFLRSCSCSSPVSALLHDGNRIDDLIKAR